MRFKRGSKVEVLSRREVPSGSWHCAEVICGNGHSYTVKYDGCRGINDESIIERISLEAIRPRPPAPRVSVHWVPGDIVEVFDKFSWKMATVLKLLGSKNFLVRLLGSVRELKVSRHAIRARRSWQDDKWIKIGKASFNNRAMWSSEADIESARLEPNVADTMTCSVGSCSTIGNYPSMMRHHYCKAFDEDAGSHTSDAESFCQLGSERENSVLSRKEQFAAEVHRLELHAYRSTMEAFYASGSLSWEQELLVTNLRLLLHISNDEHLMELRNLVSGDAGVPIS